MTNRTKAYLALLGNTALWGVALPLIKLAFKETSSFAFLFYRYFFAMVVSLPIIIFYWKKVGCKLKDLPELLGMGVLSTLLALGLLYFGLERTSAMEASLLSSVTPIFVVFGGILILKEKVPPHEEIGIALAFLGSLIIVVEPLLLGNQQMSFNHLLGNMLVILYNISWAVALIWMKKKAKKYHPFTISYTSFITGLVGFWLLTIIRQPDFDFTAIFSQTIPLMATIYMGIFGSVIAFFLYQYGQQYIEASEASIFGYLTSLFNLPLAVVLLGESPSPFFILGSLVTVIGIVVAEKRWRKRRVVAAKKKTVGKKRLQLSYT
jgi:drug/metabolite transporter (DMT)-like permease